MFINRLAKRMKLQSDPTIVYGLVGGKGTLGRGILSSEIDKPTPYNTYVIEGLPPGPIANPGRAALEAAANPSRTKDLYFVADGTGGHAFAETSTSTRATSRAGGRSSAAGPTAPSTAPSRRRRRASRRRGGAGSRDADAGSRLERPGATPPTSPRTQSGAPPLRVEAAARPGGLDASEGTPLDPLLNRSYDLNTPKTVPVLKPF